MPRRFEPGELARQLEATFPSVNAAEVLAAPVFIVSAPRSGSTLLFEQLARVAGFWTIGGESHGIFRAFPHLRAENPQFDSGCLGARHADSETRHLFRSCFLYLLRNHQGQSYLEMQAEQRPASVCLLEKTPRNALNIPFLLRVFPQARFIYLYRDPRQTVASLIEAWTLGLQSRRFNTFRHLPNWDRQAWCFLLPPGWREMRGKSLADIAAFQWTVSNKILVEELGRLASDRWTPITYQQLIDDPHAVLAGISEYVGVSFERVQNTRVDLKLSSTTISQPNADKWKRVEQEIAPLVPKLLETFAMVERFCGFDSSM